MRYLILLMLCWGVSEAHWVCPYPLLGCSIVGIDINLACIYRCTGQAPAQVPGQLDVSGQAKRPQQPQVVAMQAVRLCVPPQQITKDGKTYTYQNESVELNGQNYYRYFDENEPVHQGLRQVYGFQLNSNDYHPIMPVKLPIKVKVPVEDKAAQGPKKQSHPDNTQIKVVTISSIDTCMLDSKCMVYKDEGSVLMEQDLTNEVENLRHLPPGAQSIYNIYPTPNAQREVRSIEEFRPVKLIHGLVSRLWHSNTDANAQAQSFYDVENQILVKITQASSKLTLTAYMNNQIGSIKSPQWHTAQHSGALKLEYCNGKLVPTTGGCVNPVVLIPLETVTP